MKLKIMLLIVMLLITFSVKAQVKTSQNPNQFIEKYDSISLILMEEYNIPRSIILGISMHESGYGTSKLSINKHNYFGIKKGNYYREYNNDLESFYDFCKLLSKKEYYNYLINNNIIDYKIWINEIRKKGYSEDTNWSIKVLHYINKYKLYDKDDNCKVIQLDSIS